MLLHPPTTIHSIHTTNTHGQRRTPLGLKLLRRLSLGRRKANEWTSSNWGARQAGLEGVSLNRQRRRTPVSGRLASFNLHARQANDFGTKDPRDHAWQYFAFGA